MAARGDVVGVVAAKLNAIKFVRATGNIPENINFAIRPALCGISSITAWCRIRFPTPRLN
ncbi:hypothetical protein [Bradyrhizobium archetypum]|uniref:hypothetical protein n=1 Tax=Bradyrhizobium archetypum TaxID=2721160 RepID=UPI0028A1A038|nr:hypothetical protein [Bradyrhizobium archetypum]